MLKGFEVHFRKFWYIDGWIIVTYPMRPICKIGCILENLAKKAPNLPQIGCFLVKWYRDGSQNHAFRGIEMVEILNSTSSIPVGLRFFLKNPPPEPRSPNKPNDNTNHANDCATWNKLTPHIAFEKGLYPGRKL